MSWGFGMVNEYVKPDPYLIHFKWAQTAVLMLLLHFIKIIFLPKWELKLLEKLRINNTHVYTKFCSVAHVQFTVKIRTTIQ